MNPAELLTARPEGGFRLGRGPVWIGKPSPCAPWEVHDDRRWNTLVEIVDAESRDDAATAAVNYLKENRA